MLVVQVAGITVEDAARALSGLVITDMRGTGATVHITEAAAVTEVQVVRAAHGNGWPPPPAKDQAP
jgi:hypothetical protein